MTKHEEHDYVEGYRLGVGLMRTYGFTAITRATYNGATYVNGSKAYTAGMVDAALALVQTGVK